MNEVKKIKQNSVYSLLSISSRLIANVFIFLLIPRFYEPEAFGQFTFAHTLSNTLIILADFGFDILLTIELARNRNDASRIFRRFFTLKGIFSFSAIIVMWAFAFTFDVTASSKNLIIIFSFFLFFTTLTNFFYALFKGFEKFEYETNVSLIMNISLLIITIVFIFFRVNIIWLAVGFVVSRIIGFASGLIFSKKVFPEIRYQPLLEGFSNVKGDMLVFGFHLFFSYLFFQLDTILLTLWKGEYYVGIYQSAFKLIMLPLVIPEILINVLLPVLSRMFKENPIQWEKTGYYMNKILLIVVIPISIILFIYTKEILNLIYGFKYVEAEPILKIFAVIIFIRFSLEPFALMLTTSNRQRFRLYTVIAATILNFLLNWYFIHKYSVKGAALVSLITNSFVACLYFAAEVVFFKKWIINLKTIFLISISGLLIVFFTFIFKANILIGVSIILSFYFLFGYYFFFSSEEKRILLSDFSFLELFNKKL
jgi:O-antigen/teichoic acid export membrane protein